MTQDTIERTPTPEASLVDSAHLLGQPKALRERLEADGYVLLKGALRRDAVEAAGAYLLRTLAELDEADGPFATGRSRRRDLFPALGAVWKTVSESREIRAVTHDPALAQASAALLGGPTVVQDYAFVRAATPGKATPLHYDYPSFARTPHCVTAWIPLNRVERHQGPLAIVEGSHRFDDLIAEIGSFDLTVEKGRTSQPFNDPDAFVQDRGTRLLTTAFEPGDVLMFGMHTLHAGLENADPRNWIRLSCDVRWQLQTDPRDPRYFGPEPLGVTGGGYGELNGAMPLTELWHKR